MEKAKRVSVLWRRGIGSTWKGVIRTALFTVRVTGKFHFDRPRGVYEDAVILFIRPNFPSLEPRRHSPGFEQVL